MFRAFEGRRSAQRRLKQYRKENPLDIGEMQEVRWIMAEDVPSEVKLIRIAPVWAAMEEFEKDWVLQHLEGDKHCLARAVDALNEADQFVIAKGQARVSKKLQSKSKITVGKFNAPFADFSQLDLGGVPYESVGSDLDEQVDRLGRTGRSHRARPKHEMVVNRSNLSFSSFWKANLISPNFSLNEMRSAFFDESFFFKADLSSSDFSKSSFKKCVFWISSFRSVFDGSDFSGSRFIMGGFEPPEGEFTIRGPRGRDFTVKPIQSSAKNACFDDCIFTGVATASYNEDDDEIEYIGEFIHLDGLSFSGSSFRRARFGFSFSHTADFTGCDFRAAECVPALHGSRKVPNPEFIRCNFTKADLRGADFSNAIMENCDFTDVKFDSRTRMPPGIDLKKPSIRTRSENPILARPPRPSTGINRAGELTNRRLRTAFDGILPDEEMVDLYKGVHTSPSPLVASAYAYFRMREDFDYDDDVPLVFSEIPVLIGISTGQEKVHDVDVLTYASSLVSNSEEIYDELLVEFEEDEEEFDDFEDFLRDIEGDLFNEAAQDCAHGCIWDDFFEMFGVAGIGGSVGNRPNPVDVEENLLELVVFRNSDPEEEEVIEKALEMAAKAVPQSRYMEDIEEEEIMVVLVLPPYQRGTESEFYDEGTNEYLLEPTAFLPYLDSANDFVIRDWDEVLLEEVREWTGALFHEPDLTLEEALRMPELEWHGTSLSIAMKALPGILDSTEIKEKAEMLIKRGF